MKQLYTATVIAATLLTTGVDAQNQKVTSPRWATIVQTAVKERTPQEGRMALMAAKGIERLQHQAGDDASRGGVINDDCATAQSITLIAPDDCATAAIVGNNSAASNGAEQPGCDDPSDAGYQDVWYTFNSGAYTSSNITLTPDDPSTQDWGLVVYDACGGNEVYCEIVPSGPVTVPLNPGTDYYVRVYSNLDWGTGGPFTLCATYVIPTGAPANDECTGAISLTVGTACTPVSGNNVNATETLPASAECGDFTSPEANDVWYSFTATSDFTTVDLTGISDYDAIVEVFSGDCGNLTHMACSDNNFPQDPFDVDLTESVTVATTSGEVYYVRAYTYSVPMPASLDFTICAYQGDAPPPAPSNDDCTGAVNEDLAVGQTLTFTGDNTGATEDGATGYIMVWHAFTTTECANIMINYCVPGSEFGDHLVNLAVQCPDFITGVLTGVNDSCSVLFADLPAGTYYVPVLVDPSSTPVGAYTIEVSATECIAPTAYCIPNPTTGPADGDFIATVQLGDINYTGPNDANYVDNTDLTTDLSRNAEYTMTITGGDYAPDVYAAWIDYNHDFIFDQVTEKLGEVSTVADAGEVVTITFTVPLTADLGPARLRVRGVYGATDMMACTDYTYGETEDYTVNIEVETGVAEFNSTNVSVYPNPSNGNITVVGADLNGSVNFELTDMTGRVVYQEQKSMTSGEPVTLALNGKLAQGTYSLRMITANGISSRPVMVK